VKRRDFITLLSGSAVAWSLAAHAQQRTIPVIGVLWPGNAPPASPRMESLRQTLRQLGFVEGQNVEIQLRYAERGLQQLPELARYRIDHVRRALFYSLALVLASGLVGVVLGNVACHCIGKSDVWVTTLQVVGAGLVLWATLAVRGWEIQTFASVTLTERVNQWIYRSLSCFGTAILVMTVPWASCS
jgi:hypothetical protein